MFNISLFGGSELGRRSWNPGKRLWAISLLGGSTIDFQKAKMEPGGTGMVCISVFGGTDLIVPKNIPVSLSGLSLFGSREVKLADSEVSGSTDNVSLNVSAFAIFGSVQIRPPKDESI